MKKLDAVALQMQKLAGIITEGEYNTEMAKMAKMEAEEGSNMNTYRVVEMDNGYPNGEEMVKSPLSIADFCEELLEKHKAEMLASALDAEERAEIEDYYNSKSSEDYPSFYENGDHWEVTFSEEMGYDVYTEDQAASMNEMNKMNKMKRNSKMSEMNKMKRNSKMEEAEEDSNIEGVMSKYKQPLLKALKARQMDQESEEAHDMVESLITKIATELGYAEATTTPWMEDEMLSGEYAPQEVLEYLKDMFMDMEEDQAASMNEMNKMNKMKSASKM